MWPTTRDNLVEAKDDLLLKHSNGLVGKIKRTQFGLCE